VPYREPEGAGRAPQTFLYVPRERRWFHWIIDLAVIGVILAGVWQYAWHWEVDCAWHGMRASCTRTSEDALGRTKVQHVDGIRGLAFARDRRVGFVTDAEHAADSALFATDEIALGSNEDADELRRFADERYPRSVAYRAGLPRPVFVTVLGLLAIFAWGFFTRTRKFRIKVDPRERVLEVNAGLLRGTERYELATTSIALEHGGGGKHRVCLATKDGRRPLTEAYHPGKHHAAFVRAATAAMAPEGD
jgi:hypothetical protein